VFGKPPRTGGRISLKTAKEQLLYEVLDPRAYLTPDSCADFTPVELRELAEDRVEISGASGRARPATLKVSVGYRAGFIGEGEITYAGPNAMARGTLAGEIVRERLKGEAIEEIRVDLIGVDSAHGRGGGGNQPPPHEVRLRVAGRARDEAVAARIGEEVEALYCNGPAAGGGARKLVREIIGVASTYVPRSLVTTRTVLRRSVR
jgi:hypothetical protein